MYLFVLCLVALATLAVGVVYSSFFEWVLHKYVMHRPVWNFSYAFKAHAQTHHRKFRANHTYHLQKGDEAEAHLIRMAWWNGPALILIGVTPIALGGMPLAFSDWWAVLVVICASAGLSFALYYGAYEYLHWCMHKPNQRWIERTQLFRFLNEHHFLHHRHMGKNFNVVFPCADLLLGTLVMKPRI